MTDHLVTEFLFQNPLWTCAKTLRSLPKVQPVTSRLLKRADSMKQIGIAALDSPFSTYAADRIDGAIDVADKYVEKYLPSEDHVDCEYKNCEIGKFSKRERVQSQRKSKQKQIKSFVIHKWNGMLVAT